MSTKKENKTFVYKIRDKKTGKFFAGYSTFGDVGKEFKSEISARGSLDYFVSTTVSRQIYGKKAAITKEEIAKAFPHDLEIVKIEVIHKEDSQISLGTYMENALIANRLEDRNYQFSYFWENAMKKDYADQIQYIVKLNPTKGSTTMDMIKEARSHLRNLGVKTRTFREYRGMFGFYNKDQALKARLTLDAQDFIDITELRKEMFS